MYFFKPGTSCHFLHTILLIFIIQVFFHPTLAQTPTTTPGAYLDPDNIFCTGFDGLGNCNSCAGSLNYYLYGSVCSKYQQRTTDYFHTAPPPQQILRVCDAQCGDNSCETNGADTGLCKGCLQGSTATTWPKTAFFGYKESVPGNKKYELCITDCDHFGQLFGDTISDGGLCNNCPASCEVCNSTSTCIECDYGAQRYIGSSSGTFSDEVFKDTATPPACSGRPARTIVAVLQASSQYSRDYYLTARTGANTCTLGGCQGTFASPYDDINLIFQHILDVFLLGQKQEAQINIYLMKNTFTNGTTVNHTWTEQDLASHYTRVFERTAVDVTITPLVCSGSVTTSCFTSTQKATVILKSHKLSFFVTKTFTMKNIIMDGADLIPSSSCYDTYKGSSSRCCVDRSTSYPVKSGATLNGGAASDATCSPPTSSSSTLTVPWEAYSGTTDLWKKGPFALFTLNFLRDYPQYIPTLNLEGCTFVNFWYHRYAHSLVYLDQRGAKLNIQTSEFKRFYFPMGLISNMHKLTQRNNFFKDNLVSTSLGNCATLNPSLSNCHSLTIKDSTFNDALFGNYKMVSSLPDYYMNEGIVLSLLEFAGPITVQGNTFKNLASVKFSLADTTSLSAEVPIGCSEPRASFKTKYRMSLDRHMQVVIGHEDWEKTPKTSSVLSLRNITNGLTLYQNTFETNIAETGTALFVHNFKNTETNPIIVEKNTFNQNFATEFGSAIAIVKYERDYVTLACKGVYLSGNAFTNNFGCPYVQGTAILSCMPEKPNLSPMDEAYDEQATDIDAYMTGYFVSTNDVDSYKTLPMGEKASRFTSLSADEIDDLTREIFSKFLTDIDDNKATVNSTVHPITGATIDTNRITSYQDTFTNNYAYQSHLFIQGAPNALVQETTFKSNTVPITQFIPSSLYSSIAIFTKALGSSTYWIFSESSPLVIRMCNYIQVKGSTFDNNTQLSRTPLSLAFGAAVTIDKHLGASEVIISDSTFKNNQGWTTTGLLSRISSLVPANILSEFTYALESGVPGTLITYSKWQYMYGVSIHSANTVPMGTSGFFQYTKSVQTINLQDCTFSSNTFSIPSAGKIAESDNWKTDYRTAILRVFSAAESISSEETPSGSNINSYGTLVETLAHVVDGCTFESNTLKDQRAFINPYGFATYTISDSTFTSNSIADPTYPAEVYALGAYMYYYNSPSNTEPIFEATGLTFNKNKGKICYFEDGIGASPASSVTVTLDTIAITNHVSSPDFLMQFKEKRYISVTGITASNVTSSIGFMYIEEPDDGFTVQTIQVTGFYSYHTGCLFLTGGNDLIVVEDFVCSGSSVNTAKTFTTSSSITTSNRETKISLDDIPISSCFVLTSLGTMTFEGLECISATLIGTYTAADANAAIDYFADLPVKTLCIYSKSINDLTLNDFYCKTGTIKNTAVSKEKSYLGFFQRTKHYKLNSAQVQGNTVSGKGLYLSGGIADITSCTFDGNTADDAGSAIYAENNIYLTISGSTFNENKCDGCDGTISIQAGNLVIDGSTFSKNEAEVSAVLSARLTPVTITLSDFTENTAVSQNSVMNVDSADCSISNSNFEKNSVTDGEAALNFYDSIVSLTACTFVENYANQGPPNIKGESTNVFGYSITLFGCDFTGSGNELLSYVQGGFIYTKDYVINILSSTFTNGRAGEGGAIYALAESGANTITIFSATFTNCRASKQGEAIYGTSPGAGGVTLNLQDVNFYSGTPRAYRQNLQDLATIYLYDSLANFVNTNFYAGESDTGNHVYIELGNGHVLSSCQFHSDCSTSSCDRSESSALRLQSILGITLNNVDFIGFGSSTTSTTNLPSLGGAVKIDSDSPGFDEFMFTECTFSGNKAQYGGAVYATNCAVSFVDCEFTDNYASVSGGAIYYNASKDDITDTHCYLSGTLSFTGNEAAVSGGGYAFGKRPVTEVPGSTITYTDNVAPYGNDYASYASKLTYIEDPDSSLYEDYVARKKIQYNLERRLLQESGRMLDGDTVYESGTAIEPPLVFQLFDEYDQFTQFDSTSTLTVTATSDGDTVEVDGSPFTAENGYIITYPLRVYSNPGSTITLSFTFNFNAKTYDRTSSEFATPVAFPQPSYTFRTCITGERLTDNLVCSACSAGLYILSAGVNDMCSDCPEGGYCEGYDLFGPDVNYFKLSYTTAMVVECWNDEACLGARIDVDSYDNLYCASAREEDPTFCYTGWCDQGYTGNLCGECTDGYAYGSTSSKTCIKCSSNVRYYVISVLLAIAGIIYIVIIIRSALKEPKEDKKEDQKEDKEMVKMEGAKKEEIEGTMKLEDCEDKERMDSPPIALPLGEDTQRSNQSKEVAKSSKEIKTEGKEMDIQKEESSPENSDKAPDLQLIQIEEPFELKDDSSPQKERVKGKELSPDEDADVEDLSQSSIFMKILTNYLQFVSIIGTLDFEWPDTVTTIFGSSEKASQASENFFSFDCMLRQPLFQRAGLSSFFSKLLVMALSPIMFTVIIVLVWFLVYFIKKGRRMWQYKHRLYINIITSLVVTLFILHPSIVELSIESFKCTRLGDESDELYLDGNLEVKCWQSEHLKWAFMIGLPALIIWGLGIPFGAFYVLRHHRNDLHKEDMKAKFGFLFEGYRVKSYYWEILIFYRKMVLILISVFMSTSSTQIQGALVIGISVVNYLIHLKVAPYLTDVLNEMEKRSLIASTVTIYCGLFYLTNGLSSAVKILFFLGIIGANIYFFLFLAMQFIKYKAEELLKIKLVEKYFGRILRRIAAFEWNKKNKKKNDTISTNLKLGSVSPNVELDSGFSGLDDSPQKEKSTGLLFNKGGSAVTSPYSGEKKRPLFSSAKIHPMTPEWEDSEAKVEPGHQRARTFSPISGDLKGVEKEETGRLLKVDEFSSQVTLKNNQNILDEFEVKKESAQTVTRPTLTNIPQLFPTPSSIKMSKEEFKNPKLSKQTKPASPKNYEMPIGNISRRNPEALSIKREKEIVFDRPGSSAKLSNKSNDIFSARSVEPKENSDEERKE